MPTMSDQIWASHKNKKTFYQNKEQNLLTAIGTYFKRLGEIKTLTIQDSDLKKKKNSFHEVSSEYIFNTDIFNPQGVYQCIAMR